MVGAFWLTGTGAGTYETAMLFYQAVLLAGYAYAHFASSCLGIRRHAVMHLTLVFAAFAVLPIALPVQWFGESSMGPVSLVLAVLSISIGLPFFILSAGAPLLQKWFAGSAGRAAKVLIDAHIPDR